MFTAGGQQGAAGQLRTPKAAEKFAKSIGANVVDLRVDFSHTEYVSGALPV